jgi:hypothetical protein
MHPQTIVTQAGAWIASISRVPIGAVAGIAVWLFTLAAVQGNTENLNVTDVFIAAFGAGFTERLSVQSARAQGDDQTSTRR